MSRIKGALMEMKALKFLQQQGLKLLMRNYQSRYGEIDLIMLDKDTLVFTEVRYRQHNSHGNAVESIDFIKQKKLTTTAARFLQERRHYQNSPCRFDVVSFSKDNKSPEWIRNAF